MAIETKILTFGSSKVGTVADKLMGFKNFLPTELTGNIVWLNNDPATMTMSGANRVSEWRDISGNLHHFTQATGGNQPLYVANAINGQNGIQWENGTNQWLARNFGVTYTQPIDIFVVWNLDVNSTATFPYVFDRNATGDRFSLFWNANNIRVGSPTQATAYGGKTRPFNLMNTNVMFNNTLTRVYENGTLKNTVTTGTGALTTLRLGHLGAIDATTRLSGFICEVIIYNRELNSVERVLVNDYLSSKYGL